MYIIMLTNGKSIKITATEVDWCHNSKTIVFYFNNHVVARINMDNIVGWIEAARIKSVESEE